MIVTIHSLHWAQLQALLTVSNWLPPLLLAHYTIMLYLLRPLPRLMPSPEAGLCLVWQSARAKKIMKPLVLTIEIVESDSRNNFPHYALYGKKTTVDPKRLVPVTQTCW